MIIDHDSPVSARYAIVDLCQRGPSRALWNGEEHTFPDINAVAEWAMNLPAGVALVVEGHGHDYVLSAVHHRWRAMGRKSYNAPCGIILSREPKRAVASDLPRIDL